MIHSVVFGMVHHTHVKRKTTVYDDSSGKSKGKAGGAESVRQPLRAVQSRAASENKQPAKGDFDAAKKDGGPKSVSAADESSKVGDLDLSAFNDPQLSARGNEIIEEICAVAASGGLATNELVVEFLMGLYGAKANAPVIAALRDALVDWITTKMLSTKVSAVKGAVTQWSIKYHIDNLVLSDLHIPREGFSLSSPHPDLLQFKFTGIRCTIDKLLWGFAKQSFPKMCDGGEASVRVTNGRIALTLRVERGSAQDLTSAVESATQTCDRLSGAGLRTVSTPRAAAVAAAAPAAVESKSPSAASASAESKSAAALPPPVCPARLRVHGASVDFAELKLKVEARGGGALTWLYNSLLGAFSDSIKQALQRQLTKAVGAMSGQVAARLDALLATPFCF